MGPLHMFWLLEQHWSISTKLSILLFTSKALLYHISSWYHWECQVRQESCRNTIWILEYVICLSSFAPPCQYLLSPAKFPSHQEYPFWRGYFPSCGSVCMKYTFCQIGSPYYRVQMLGSGKQDLDSITSVKGDEFKSSSLD